MDRDPATERRQIEEALLEEVRAAQHDYYAAAEEHRTVIEDARKLRFRTDADGSQLLHAKQVQESDALNRYVRAMQAFAEAVLHGARSDGQGAASSLLTERETEVLKLIVDGLSSKEIASRLGIAFRTAVCHRYRIMEKLNVHNAAELVRYSMRNRLIEP